MNRYRFIVTYEGYVLANTPEEAQEYALEEVRADVWPVSDTEVWRELPRKDATHDAAAGE